MTSAKAASSVPRASRVPPGLPAVGPSAVVIGNFDGVHRGHQAVLTEARALAAASSLAVRVLTFDPHPAEVLAGAERALLTAIPRRAALLLSFADRVAIRTFDRAFAQTSPEDFARSLAEDLGASLVVVGQNFRFGHQRAGDLARLGELGRALGFQVHAHALAGDADGRFSSSRARNAVTSGALDVATHVLGRPHAIGGEVVHGDQRGRTIGFPTANLGGVPELVPPRGVYAVRVFRVTSPADALVEALEPLADGVMNHGVRPTVAEGLRPSLEVHLLDFAGDLYGSRLRVELVAKVRDEKKFDGLPALKAQIAEDVESARAALRTAPDAMKMAPP